MMQMVSHRALALLVVLVLGLAIIGTGCSGGGGGGGGNQLRVTAVNVDSTLLSQGIVCVNFDVAGPANTIFDLIAEYVITIGGVQTFVPMSEISFFTQTSQALTSSGTTGLDIATVSFSFYWAAGQDLGFIQPPPSLQIRLTPFSNGDPTNPNGLGLSSAVFVLNLIASNPSTGPLATIDQRAEHTGHYVRIGNSVGTILDNIMVAGGKNSVTPPNNGVNTALRYEFDRNNAAGASVTSFSNTFPGGVRRVLHAAAMFLDPATNNLKVLITGGVDGCASPGLNPGAPNLGTQVVGATQSSSCDIYQFGSVSTGASMSGPRFAHTATWTQDNEIVVIGGAAGTGGLLPTVGLSTIEAYDPVSNSWTTKGATLGAPRAGHTATLLGDGRVLIFGGFTPGSAAVLPVEIYNPLTGAVTALPAPPATMNIGRHEHTVTRLFDGRLLIAGGRSIVNGALFADALIYNAQGIPQAAVGMDQTRAQHAATLMGNGHVLFTGGVGGIGVAPFESFTTTVAVWSPTTNFFTPVDSLIAGRGDHTATAGGSGSVYVIGGRNGSPLGNNFLIDLEFYSFSNSVPFIPQVATSTASTTNMVSIDFDVEDEDGDGGYASCRYRETSLLPGVTDWHQCTISSQVMPGGAVVAPPTFMIIPGANSFIWDFTSDGVPAGTQVEVEVLPVGCVLGTPKRMVVETTL